MKFQSRPLELKPLFTERMKELFGDEREYSEYLKSLEKPVLNSIRCNTLKISPENLKKRLEKRGWKIDQPWKNHKEVMVVKNDLLPGELGRSLEHLLGYYYIQELSSMLPVIALNTKKGEMVLDLCASPGSKTTQMSACMENEGTIIANEINLGRLRILATNLERCGVANAVITKKEGSALCRRLERRKILFDKILVDAPCSGEGTLRSTPKTAIMWNINTVKQLSNIQKNLVSSVIPLLKQGGTLVYSTCTHSPEENEGTVDFILKNFPEMKIEKTALPVECKEGIEHWQDKQYSKEVKHSCRIYPHVSDTEGFFVAKFRKGK